MENNLEKRMYFLVPYNISPIQQGIQAGHSMGEYALKYGRYNSEHLIWEFLEQWKTWMILNGGTTNFEMIEVGDEKEFIGSLNQIEESLKKNNIEHSTFIEPDLNNALTAVCLIVDERVFNREDYPDFPEWQLEQAKSGLQFDINSNEMKEIHMKETDINEEIVFLKELLNNKRLA